MVKLDHDDVAQNADMGSVYDRLAEHFRREIDAIDPRDAIRASDMVAEVQDDGWDNDCA